jgi:hypothetical protein
VVHSIKHFLPVLKQQYILYAAFDKTFFCKP